jgi:phage I-like protein
MPAGRPSEYDYNLCLEICIRVSEGENIKHVLASDERYPRFNTWCDWKRNNEQLSNLYTRSIQDKAESKEAEIEEYKEKLLNGTIDPATARVLIDTSKWQAAKFYPKMFGDKTAVDLTSGGDKITWNEVKTYNKE